MAAVRTLGGFSTTLRSRGCKLNNLSPRPFHTALIVHSKDSGSKDGLERGAYHDIHKSKEKLSEEERLQAEQQQKQERMDKVFSRLRQQSTPRHGAQYGKNVCGSHTSMVDRRAALAHSVEIKTRSPAPVTIALEDLVTSNTLGNLTCKDSEKFVSVAKTKVAWPDGLKKQFSLIREEVVMARKPAVRLANVIDSIRTAKKIERDIEDKGGNRDNTEEEKAGTDMSVFFVHGARGTGKSTMLSHVASACLERGWIVFQVPNALKLTYKASRLQLSKWHPGLYDLPFDAADLLLKFKEANQKLLSEIKLTDNYQFDKIQLSSSNSLLDLVSAGSGPFDLDSLSKPPPSSDVLRAVFEELRKVESAPVLITVDAFNAFYNVSHLRGLDTKLLHALQLSISHDFINFFNNPLKRGALLLGLTETGVTSNQKYSPEIQEALRMAELMELDSEDAEIDARSSPVWRYRLDRMDMQELRAFLSYYRQKGLLSRDVDSRVVDEIHCMSSGVPEEVARICAIA